MSAAQGDLAEKLLNLLPTQMWSLINWGRVAERRKERIRIPIPPLGDCGPKEIVLGPLAYTRIDVARADLSDDYEMPDEEAKRITDRLERLVDFKTQKMFLTGAPPAPTPHFQPYHVMDAWISAFEIGDPIKTWLKPRILVDAGDWRDGPRPKLHVHSRSPDSDRPGQTIELVMVECVPPLLPDQAAFHGFLRHVLEKLLKHELGEAIRVAGRKPFDPHRRLPR